MTEPNQFTLAELRALTPERIAKALADGQLDAVISGFNPEDDIAQADPRSILRGKTPEQIVAMEAAGELDGLMGRGA